MTMIKCSECGKDISDKSAACIGCGAPIANTIPDDESEFSALQIAAEQGDAEAQCILGVFYYIGEEVPVDFEKAVSLFRLAADQGDAEAQFWFGVCCLNGDGVRKDNKEAVHWFRLAAEQGNASAQCALGSRYFAGEGVTEDINEAVRWYRLAAEQGDANAQCCLGSRYLAGEGVPEDHKEAVRLFLLAADQGDADAQDNLGTMHSLGLGVPKNDKQAVHWYRQAADQSHASAQNHLGVMYSDGSGVPEDNDEAIRWFRLAAEQGDADAQDNLGTMCSLGLGVPKYDKEAVHWYRLAAEQGHAGAQNHLGVMYSEGQGVPQNTDEAAKWFRLAADQGDDNAKDNLGPMNFREDMQRELDDAQKEYSEGNSFVLNRDQFLKHFFDSKTQGSLSTTAINEVISATAGGVGGATLLNTVYLASTPWWTLGLATTPVGWLIAAAGGGYVVFKLLNKGREGVESRIYDKTAKYIGGPMDQIARGLCQLTMPVAIAAAYSDGNYDSIEREIIVNHFIQKWGLNPKAVNELMTEFESMDPMEWDTLEWADTIKKSIAEMTKGTKGLDRKNLEKKVCTGIVKLALQVVESDGVVQRSERRFIKRLGRDLGVPELVSVML